MKLKQFHRMARNTDKSNKDSDDMNNKSSSRKAPPSRNRKRNPPADDDDSSVDSHGNIRGLIAYSDTEEEITTTEESSENINEQDDSDEEYIPKKSNIIPRKPRVAALRAREKIRRKMMNEKKSTTKPIPIKNSSKILKKKFVVETSDEEEDEMSVVDEIAELKRKLKKAEHARRMRKITEEEELEDAETLGSQDTDEDDDDEEEDEDEYDDEDGDEDGDEGDELPAAGISINIGSFGSGGDDYMERMIPKRHNMKKESAEVKKFVELVTKPMEANTIDDQIDQFKTLEPEKQRTMLEALDKRPPSSEQNLMFKILTMNLPPETQSMVLAKYHSLQTIDPGSGEYFKMRNWLEKLTSVPLGIYKNIPVKIEDGSEACTSFMERARRCLEEAIYGQEEAKLQILQFIATKISNPNGNGLSLLLSGPPGIGKTSLIKNGIAKALDWPFQFISLGGDSDATTYTGHQLVYESSHAGKIANSLIAAKSMSMVLMFDEVDKISQTPKGEEVQNLLIHLTDQVQNSHFEDKYLAGVPLDLSKVMFVFSGNDLGKIDKILLDRMMVIQLQGYKEKDKLAIAENFLVPSALREVNLGEKVAMSREVIEYMLKNYAGEESGVRELKRCVEQVTQKINMLRIFNAKELPFYIKDFQLPFVVKKEHIDLFLKKKDLGGMDVSVKHMYL